MNVGVTTHTTKSYDVELHFESVVELHRFLACLEFVARLRKPGAARDLAEDICQRVKTEVAES